MRVFLLMCFLVTVEGGSDTERAYAEGRFGDALKLFEAAERSQGQHASPELLHNTALAALQAGELVMAEISAEKAAARGGGSFLGIRDFLLGNIAFVRAARAEALSLRPEAGPPALAAAIDHAESARMFWRRAAMSRPDWPQARRNAERADAKLLELNKRREQARRRSGKSAGRATPKPLPAQQQKEEDESDPRAQRKTRRTARRIEALEGELSQQQVRHLLDKLAEKEIEKRRIRELRRRTRTISVERDW